MASKGPVVKTLYKSKTSTTNCGYCKKPIKTENLKNHCLNVHKRPRLADGERTIQSLFQPKGPICENDAGDTTLVSDEEVLKGDGVDDDFNISEADESIEKGKKRKQERKLPRELFMRVYMSTTTQIMTVALSWMS